MSPLPPAKPNRLAKLVHQPGGVSMNEAVRAANASLEGLRETVVGEVEATLDRMQAIGAGLRSGPDEPALAELYALSNVIIGMAGVFGMERFGAVAYSLCELIERIRRRGKWDAPAVQLHLDTLRRLRAEPAGDDAQHERVVAGLRQLVSRL